MLGDGVGVGMLGDGVGVGVLGDGLGVGVLGEGVGSGVLGDGVGVRGSVSPGMAAPPGVAACDAAAGAMMS